MNIILSVDRNTPMASPSDETIEDWVCRALASAQSRSGHTPELSIRITDDDEAANFNQTFRAKPGATNVLSFPADLPPDAESGLLGDLVICAPLVEREAAQQAKPVEAHWAHLIIHGVLHLLGHDHQTSAEAELMERLEIDLLHQLGFPNPYDCQQPPEGAAL